LNRYKETRRKHPLMDSNNYSLEEAIDKEREILRTIKDKADYFIDTTHITTIQLKQSVLDICKNEPISSLQIKLMSFGYKHGIPNDADVIFDVRCLPNPFYVPELKTLTGMNQEVYDYVFSFPQSRELAEKLTDLFRFSVPLYVAEGKSQLVVAIGCTGGKHRSVSCVRYLKDHLHFEDVTIVTAHRDIDKTSK